MAQIVWRLKCIRNYYRDKFLLYFPCIYLAGHNLLLVHGVNLVKTDIDGQQWKGWMLVLSWLLHQAQCSWVPQRDMVTGPALSASEHKPATENLSTNWGWRRTREVRRTQKNACSLRDQEDQEDWEKETNLTDLQRQRFVLELEGLDTAGPVQEALENRSPRQQSFRKKPTTKRCRQQLGDACFQTTYISHIRCII